MKRKALNRHNRRSRPHGIAAATLIAPHQPAPAVTDETAPMLLPGLRPALAR